MSSMVGKFKVDLVCPRCSKNIRWAWVVRYKGYRYARYVYLCAHCGAAIKVAKQEPTSAEHAPQTLDASPSTPPEDGPTYCRPRRLNRWNWKLGVI